MIDGALSNFSVTGTQMLVSVRQSETVLRQVYYRNSMENVWIDNGMGFWEVTETATLLARKVAAVLVGNFTLLA